MLVVRLRVPGAVAEVVPGEAVVLDGVGRRVDRGAVRLAAAAWGGRRCPRRLAIGRHSDGRGDVDAGFHLLAPFEVLFVIVHKSLQRPRAVLTTAPATAIAHSVRRVIKNILFRGCPGLEVAVSGDGSEAGVYGLAGRVGHVVVLGQVAAVVPVLVRGDRGVQHLL